MKPVFDDNGLAKEPGNVRCFYYDLETGEYTGWSDEYINVGVSMPGNSTDIDPGETVTGKVSLFTGTGWRLEEDHRGDMVYSVENKQESVINYIGPVRDGFVVVAPTSPFDKWDGKKWVADAEAQHTADVAEAEQKKGFLLTEANIALTPLQDAFELDMATDAEKSLLLAWKKYRVLLMRVDTAKPVWPTPPGEPAS
ncbi:TPA: tail fiber assembly protein [Citrobacter farmeri]|nr:tail fiber assembly protein [Citrobacter farmeri]HCB1665760.1 tail fiber assembly protein [Citrobacter farmeri]HCB1672217.1 tail fiber assembly protein [Citrobacter farmeri]HCB1782151.1 tail fiber assembly protein [Citrobacter farmeri]HCB1941681.1 tail fiber assembly protein [Citrobacter farmeri]